MPEAERPVSQMVRPCCLRRSFRSLRVRAAAWKVMLLEVGFSIVALPLVVDPIAGVMVIERCFSDLEGGNCTYVAIVRDVYVQKGKVMKKRVGIELNEGQRDGETGPRKSGNEC